MRTVTIGGNVFIPTFHTRFLVLFRGDNFSVFFDTLLVSSHKVPNPVPVTANTSEKRRYDVASLPLSRSCNAGRCVRGSTDCRPRAPAQS